MQPAIRPVVPDSEKSHAVIDAFYDHLKDKYQEGDFDPDERDELGEIEFHRERAHSEFDENDRFPLYEYIHLDASLVDEFHDLEALMRKHDYVICEPETIETVLDLLETIKRKLIELSPIEIRGRVSTEEAIERMMDVGTIAVCEFALEHGYCIKWM